MSPYNKKIYASLRYSLENMAWTTIPAFFAGVNFYWTVNKIMEGNYKGAIFPGILTLILGGSSVVINYKLRKKGVDQLNKLKNKVNELEKNLKMLEKK